MELSIQPQINCGHNGTIGKCKCLIPSAGLALEWAYIPHTHTKCFGIYQALEHSVPKNLIGHFEYNTVLFEQYCLQCAAF